MAVADAESIPGYLMKLLDVAERQMASVQELGVILREHMAHTDARFSQAADMFIQVGSWVRGQGDEIVRTNERLAQTNERLDRLEQHIEQLLRALLRGRGDGEGKVP